MFPKEVDHNSDSSKKASELVAKVLKLIISKGEVGGLGRLLAWKPTKKKTKMSDFFVVTSKKTDGILEKLEKKVIKKKYAPFLDQKFKKQYLVDHGDLKVFKNIYSPAG